MSDELLNANLIQAVQRIVSDVLSVTSLKSICFSNINGNNTTGQIFSRTSMNDMMAMVNKIENQESRQKIFIYRGSLNSFLKFLATHLGVVTCTESGSSILESMYGLEVREYSEIGVVLIGTRQAFRKHIDQPNIEWKMTTEDKTHESS